MAGKTKKPRNKKVDVFVEEVVKHGNQTKAAAVAGYKQPRMAGSRLMTNDDIFERVERRKAEAMRRANIHTDVIVGSLAEIATSSLADVIPNDEFMRNAKELGTDHLIKKLRVKTRRIPQKGHDKEGNPMPDITETTHEFEMYSRLDALNQLRDNFGMKQEARRNDEDVEVIRTEIEKSLNRIIERDGVDRPQAVLILREDIKDAAPQLLPHVH